MLITNSIFINMSNPLSIGIILIIQTIMISMTSGTMMPNFWFSYILILIYLGGMLILFVYMASLASNEKFSFKAYSLTMIMMMILIPLLMSSESHMSKDMKMKEYINLVPPITSSSASMTTILVIYLLLTLLVVVKITKFWQGPLRKNN